MVFAAPVWLPVSVSRKSPAPTLTTVAETPAWAALIFTEMSVKASVLLTEIVLPLSVKLPARPRAVLPLLTDPETTFCADASRVTERLWSPMVAPGSAVMLAAAAFEEVAVAAVNVAGVFSALAALCKADRPMLSCCQDASCPL